MDNPYSKRFSKSVRLESWGSLGQLNSIVVSEYIAMALSEQEQRNLILQIHNSNIGASKAFIVNLCKSAVLREPRPTGYYPG